MQRKTIIAAGLFCLVLAAVFLEVPPAIAPLTAPSIGLITKEDSGPKLATASDEAAAVTAPSMVEEPVSAHDAWLNALTEVELAPFDQAAPIIARAMQCPDREVRVRAVELLIAAKDNPASLPMLGIAQSDADAEVRRDAVVALANSSLKENLTPYLLRSALDQDAEVREALVQTVWSLAPAQRDEFLAQALNSSEPDVVSAAFGMLNHESSTQTVSLLLGVYATNNAARIQQANDVMDHLLGQTFDNAAQAAGWWSEHHAEYNDDLSQKLDVVTENP